MARKACKEIAWAQNFLVDRKLVRRLVGASTIGSEDVVYEIGPGRGIITAELSRIARRVVALEIDPALVRGLRDRFRGTPNVEIVEGDFLDRRIGDPAYKIFANIPFNRTAEIVRRILRRAPALRDAFLVVQKEAAEKFCGSPKETRFSLLAKPFFRIRILRTLRRTDFSPVPGVDSVLLHIQPRETPLIPDRDAALYRDFVCCGFGVWKRSVRLILKPLFSYRRWKRLSRDLRIPSAAAPSELTFEQWLGLFHFFRRGVCGDGLRGGNKV